MQRLRLTLLALLAVLALVAAGCGGDDDADTGTEAGTEAEADTEADAGTEAEAEGTDTEGAAEDDDQAGAGGEFSVYIGEPQSLTPTNTNETNGSEVLNALFTGLVEYDPETSEPLLGDEAARAMAQSIETEDQQTYTITLKEGYTFHDGTPVTAQSYVDSWNYAAYGPNAQGNSYFMGNIQGYDELQCGEGDEGPDCEAAPPASEEMSGLAAPDETTIEVTLNEPFSQFPLTVGYTAFYPMPEAFFSDPDTYNEAPIGNGPFMMDGEWNHDQAVNVVRYEDFAGEPAQADAIEFRIYAEQTTGYNDLLAGSLDVMDALPPENIPQAPDEFGDRYIERESSSHTYLGFPLYDERFSNPDLRIAFSKAIDREAIVEAVRPDQTAAYSVVSPVVAGAREDPCGDNCAYDPEAAMELFESAGGYEGTLTLWFNAGAGHDEWVQAVANQLQQNLGITDVEFETLQFAEYLGLLDNEEITGPYRLGWVMDYPSPQNYLEPIFGSEGSSNNSGYSNPEVDELIAQGNAAESVDAGIEFYNQAEDIILQDMPHIPIFFGRVSAATSENVDNVVIDAFTQIRTADITVNQ
ncbi:ABC transporter substrate-binding protein [soil metagenome]